MKRIFLFLLTNLAVVLVLSIVLKLFGIDRSLAMQGYNWTTLLVYALVVGFVDGGADLLQYVERPAEGQILFLIEYLAERAAVEVFHDEVRHLTHRR